LIEWQLNTSLHWRLGVPVQAFFTGWKALLRSYGDYPLSPINLIVS